MKLSQLSLADYNKLDNIPVINQDLTASGFTPVANTYYRHTGATTDTFTQGVIYCYDGTEYKALDGSGGGGMTLNRYIFTLSKNSDAIQRAERIFVKSKGKCTFFLGPLSDSSTNIALGEPVATGLNGGSSNLSFLVQNVFFSSDTTVALFAYNINGYNNPTEKKIIINADGTITFTRKILSTYDVYVIYHNDTEIT